MIKVISGVASAFAMFKAIQGGEGLSLSKRIEPIIKTGSAILLGSVIANRFGIFGNFKSDNVVRLARFLIPSQMTFSQIKDFIQDITEIDPEERESIVRQTSRIITEGMNGYILVPLEYYPRGLN